MVVILLEVPKPVRPTGHSVAAGDQGPVFVFDLLPDFRGYARGAYGGFIPAVRRLCTNLRFYLLVRGSQLGSAILKGRFAVGGHLAFDGFDERWKRLFGVRPDGEINLLITAKILVIAVHEQVERADRDHLCARL